MIGQNLLKIKHKVKWMIEFVKTKKPQLLHTFLPTKQLGKIRTKQLGKIRRSGYKQILYSLLYVNSLKKFLGTKTKLTVVKNVHFFILTASKNIKTQKIKFEVGFCYKDCI